MPPELAEAWGLVSARVGPIGHRVSWFEQIGSTNDEALALAGRGAAEGWLVGADAQLAGRGRHGRSWASPQLAGLYLSIVLRPPAHAVSLLTLAAGVGVADGLERASGLPSRLKWPNDVYVTPLRPRKIAGILTEGGASGGIVDYAVVGIGVNVYRTMWPAALGGRATSIEDELGRPPDRGLVAAEVCAGVWYWYQALVRGRGAAVLDAWRHRGADLMGRRVEWDAGGAAQSGLARDVDESGALVVETRTGTVRLAAGEVRWT
jgi:BirA family biotin operon repressor/biotin-[acetyl-CoA-carboxylase] ligase